MPDYKDTILQDLAIENQISLLRFTAGEQKNVLAILTTLQKDLRLKLMGDLTDFGRARTNKLLREATAVIDSAYKEIIPKKVGAFNPLDILTGKTTEKPFNPLDLLLSKPPKKAAVKEAVAKKITGPEIEKEIASITAEIKDWRSRVYKEGKRVVGAGGTADDFNSTLTTTGSANERRRRAAIALREKAVQELREAKRKIVAGENAVAVYTDLLDSGSLHVVRFAEKQIKVEATVKATEQLATGADDLLGLAKQQAVAAANSFTAIGLTAALPTEAALKALVNGSLIEGAPSAAWWAKQSEDTAFKFKAQVRQGIAANETVQQIVRRIVGSPRLGTPGIMETSRRGATALVHTSIQQVSNDARLATFKANDDIVKGVMQLSTLDSHTTKICIAYSGAAWDLNGNPIDGNTLPFNGGTPRHFNCRSVLTSITKTYKELGIDIPDAPPGTRASDLGQIPATTTFESFLERHDSQYMDNLLGPGRAKLYRDGKITLQQLVDGRGRPLTLKQLEAL